MAEGRLPFVRGGTVRARVTSLAVVLFAVVLGVASVALVITQRQVRLAGVDDALRNRADDLEALLAESPGLSGEQLATSPDTVAQVVDADGVVLATSHPVSAAQPLAPPGVGQEFSTTDALAVDDDVFRVLRRGLDGGRTIYVARSIDAVDEAQTVLIATLAALVPAVTIVLGAAVWVLVGRTLQPVERIRAEVATIGADRLDRRVPVPEGSDEISRLARTMNEMLARVEHSHERQRQFTADASHELRSPLTRMRSELEVDLAHPAGADASATHRSVLEEVDVLQRTIDDLLLLARGGEERAGRDVLVDLDDVVLREAGLVDAAGKQIDVSGVSGAQVRGDDLELGRVVRNLLDNAARHARRRVSVAVSEEGEEAVLRVLDDGDGVPLAERERVFERFTRLDEARLVGGSGLGLAIVRDIVQRHGGRVGVEPTDVSGALFVVRLPRSR